MLSSYPILIPLPAAFPSVPMLTDNFPHSPLSVCDTRGGGWGFFTLILLKQAHASVMAAGHNQHCPTRHHRTAGTHPRAKTSECLEKGNLSSSVSGESWRMISGARWHSQPFWIRSLFSLL